MVQTRRATEKSTDPYAARVPPQHRTHATAGHAPTPRRRYESDCDGDEDANVGSADDERLDEGGSSDDEIDEDGETDDDDDFLHMPPARSRGAGRRTTILH